MASKNILEVQDLNVHYGASHALHNICFEVKEGHLLALMGRNGAGKRCGEMVRGNGAGGPHAFLLNQDGRQLRRAAEREEPHLRRRAVGDVPGRRSASLTAGRGAVFPSRESSGT